MLLTVSTLALLVPFAMGLCDMPSQMFGTAVYTPTSSEIDSHYIAVDFIAKKAIIWPFVDGYSGRASISAYITTEFQYFNYNEKKVYTMNKKGDCSIDEIDSRLDIPVVNPSTDDIDDSYHGRWNSIYKKGDIDLMVTKSTCRPYTGSLLQIKWGEPITMSYTFYETPIEKYNILKPDISKCK